MGGSDHHRFSKIDSETLDLCRRVVTEATKTCYIEMNWQQQLKLCIRSSICCEEIVASCRMASTFYLRILSVFQRDKYLCRIHTTFKRNDLV